MKRGDIIKVFDPSLWNGKDEGDNSQFWKWAMVTRVNEHMDWCNVIFAHDGRESKGHIISMLVTHPHFKRLEDLEEELIAIGERERERIEIERLVVFTNS